MLGLLSLLSDELEAYWFEHYFLTGWIMSEIIHRHCTCEHLQIDHDLWGGGNCTQCDCEKFNHAILVSVSDLMDIQAEIEDMAITIGCEFGGCVCGASRQDNIKLLIEEGDLSGAYLTVVKLLKDKL